MLNLKKRWRELEDLVPGKPFWLEEYINLIDWSAATDWTEVDIRPYVDDYTQTALLIVELYFEATGPGQPKMVGKFRKGGSTATTGLPRILNEFKHDAARIIFGYRPAIFIPVKVNNFIFETKLETLGGNPDSIDFTVDLIGYSL